MIIKVTTFPFLGMYICQTSFFDSGTKCTRGLNCTGTWPRFLLGSNSVYLFAPIQTWRGSNQFATRRSTCHVHGFGSHKLVSNLCYRCQTLWRWCDMKTYSSSTRKQIAYWSWERPAFHISYLPFWSERRSVNGSECLVNVAADSLDEIWLSKVWWMGSTEWFPWAYHSFSLWCWSMQRWSHPLCTALCRFL